MKRIFASLLLFALVAQAAAQSFVVSPQAIVVNPRPSFDVQVWLDRDPSGEGAPSYQIGEEVRISVRPSETSYIYVFDVKTSGEITQIFPNRYESNNRVSANQTVTMPPSNARYVFNIAPPQGLSKVIAVASREPLDTSTIARFESGNADFAQSTIGEEGFVRSFGIVVNPIPQRDWVTDTVLYYVGGAPNQPEYTTLRLESNPSGAEAYVDGSFVGFTPVDFGVRSGRHEVRFELSGYQPLVTSVNIGRGQRLEVVSGNLTRVQTDGSVSFTSNPSGADVYVDGRYVGTTPTAALRFSQGSYTARFEAPGYESATVRFTVQSGRDQTVNANLNATLGTVVVQANVGGALVFLDGRQVGTIPSGSGRLSIPNVETGTHELVVIAPRYSTYVTTFSVSPGRTVQLTVRQSRY